MYLWLSEYIPNIPHFFITETLWDFPADVDKMSSLNFWSYQTELLFWDGVYWKHTQIPTHLVRINEWITCNMQSSGLC